MPVGKPTARTRATEKYQNKVGLVSKAYKLKKSVVEDFAKACEQQGVAQSAQLTKMMLEYIEKNLNC